ncbi:MAG: hypothetical protein UR35_C0009G0018 [Candidatus Woesebacteria bacterium GW2011_GWB1_33_22]|uniref:Polymerase beta nucleotidyltransferase domain-containing protein n=1 Tax=Candidatus Woesebacteria bacterium GW2011_GWB1_33_22 TaxID=1618566 RepID=A0A0G0CLK9_9BACT|nr:MAG: hypothetical protein UR35_C0009G0018 [Candidatus Woesebacteria bacterium GW2011_GWB1_33_22]
MDLTDREKSKLLELGVDALILFGSQAQKKANINSDYDFYVIGIKSTNTYNYLYEIFIDIVFDSDATMELKNHLITYGNVIYQKNEKIFPNFKEQVMANYQDFAHYRQTFQQATLDRIN